MKRVNVTVPRREGNLFFDPAEYVGLVLTVLVEGRAVAPARVVAAALDGEAVGLELDVPDGAAEYVEREDDPRECLGGLPA